MNLKNLFLTAALALTISAMTARAGNGLGEGVGVLQTILSNGDLNDQRLEIRTQDQIAVETNALRQDKLDQLKGL
jgi:hypothetical protein